MRPHSIKSEVNFTFGPLFTPKGNWPPYAHNNL